MLSYVLSKPSSVLTKSKPLLRHSVKRRDSFNRIMNAKWILVLFAGTLMVLHISSADVNDEWLNQGAGFGNGQPQKRSESLNLILLVFRFVLFRLSWYMDRFL